MSRNISRSVQSTLIMQEEIDQLKQDNKVLEDALKRIRSDRNLDNWHVIYDIIDKALVKANEANKCNCESYNNPMSTNNNSSVQVKILYNPFNSDKETCIDSCIADHINALWQAAIPTLSCCCGHNRFQPSVVLSDSDDAKEAKRVLGEFNDGRRWEITAWKRVILSS